MANLGGIKSLQVLHSALLSGQVILLGIVLYLVYSGNSIPSMTGMDRNLQLVAIVVSAVCIIGGLQLFKRKVGQARDSQTGIKDKFIVYRGACILLWALLEAPVLVCGICFFLTGNTAFLLRAAALLLFFTIMGPSLKKTSLHLQVDESALMDL